MDAPTPKQRPTWRQKLSDWWSHAFAVEKYDESSLTEDERGILDRLAQRIHDKKMTAAAILWVDSHRHMNFIASQALVFANPSYELAHPMLRFLLQKLGIYIPPGEVYQLAQALEKRYSIEYFVRRLEALGSAEYNKGPEASEAETADGAGPDGTEISPQDKE
jgi:hypothetical protein